MCTYTKKYLLLVIPLISNIWIGPDIIYMINNHWGVGLSIGSVL